FRWVRFRSAVGGTSKPNEGCSISMLPVSHLGALGLKHHQALMSSLIPLGQYPPFCESTNCAAVFRPRPVMQENKAALVRQIRTQPVEYQTAIESVDEEHIESDREQLVNP